MDPGGGGDTWRQNCECDELDKELLKPLARRKLQHQRCLAHSLVGTPNYIAPEVLSRQGESPALMTWHVLSSVDCHNLARKTI